ncbi:major coat protein [Salinicola acroporae]|uniref:Phage coat protein n=1 Tax=Salinicola acroporae TaxID=1541440 RepID=A0ABT6HZU3_9GAMM|nr:major coat protein [Salinicola acroporae]MDH4571030.1 hypothetical protein [Salinicola acroporae]
MKTQLKNAVARTRNIAKSVSGKAALVGAGSLAGTGAAMASEGSQPWSEAFSTLSVQATGMAAEAWPVVVGVVGSLLAIGLFKKFANKAT